MESEELIRWVFSQDRPTITTTSFGEYSAVLLHMVHKINPNATFVWLNTQFNTESTLAFKKNICEHLQINLVSYIGKEWPEEIPPATSPEYKKFVEQVKLSPFRRVINDLKPEFWIAGLRREETPYRRNMDLVTNSNGITKVAPLLNWTTRDMEQYLKANNLPNESVYRDPTKPTKDCECGLHTKKFR